MITVSGATFDISSIINNYPHDSIQNQLLNAMAISDETYQYDNLKQLKFELDFRNEIVKTAIDLNNSDLSFADFKDSRCNPLYWNRTSNGGFLLREDARPNEAVNDIFENGDNYATECATVIMIIYYKGLLNLYGDDLFNNLFPVIYLMGWDVREPLLVEASRPQMVADFLLGDRVYFFNPDFNPETPEWVGENAILLPDSMFYGHGIGITTADDIIHTLNEKRHENATHSAYLLRSVGRPNFKKLSDVFYNASR